MGGTLFMIINYNVIPPLKLCQHRVSMGSTLFMIINYNVIPPVTEPIFVSHVWNP